MKELYCHVCRKYTDHEDLDPSFSSVKSSLEEPKIVTTCLICGQIYDHSKKRYIITGPENDPEVIKSRLELLEKDPDAIIIPEEIAMAQRLKGINTKPMNIAMKTEGYPGTGRNELCPCGSGKKYKRCCLNGRNGDKS